MMELSTRGGERSGASGGVTDQQSHMLLGAKSILECKLQKCMFNQPFDFLVDFIRPSMLWTQEKGIEKECLMTLLLTCANGAELLFDFPFPLESQFDFEKLRPQLSRNKQPIMFSIVGNPIKHTNIGHWAQKASKIYPPHDLTCLGSNSCNTIRWPDIGQYFPLYVFQFIKSLNRAMCVVYLNLADRLERFGIEKMQC